MAKIPASTKKKIKRKTQKKGTAKLSKNAYSHGQDFHNCPTEEAWEFANE